MEPLIFAQIDFKHHSAITRDLFHLLSITNYHS